MYKQDLFLNFHFKILRKSLYLKVMLHVSQRRFLAQHSFAILLHNFYDIVSVIDYNAEGCYKDSKKKSKKIFTKKFSTVEGVNRKNPDVEKIFLKCKDLAEKEGYEIFAIQVKVLVYNKYILKSECQWSVSFRLNNVSVSNCTI